MVEDRLGTYRLNDLEERVKYLEKSVDKQFIIIRLMAELLDEREKVQNV